jgi:hypothetical protein
MINPLQDRGWGISNLWSHSFVYSVNSSEHPLGASTVLRTGKTATKMEEPATLSLPDSVWLRHGEVALRIPRRAEPVTLMECLSVFSFMPHGPCLFCPPP